MEPTEFFNGVVELARNDELTNVFSRYGIIHVYLEDGDQSMRNYPLLRGEYVLDRKGLRAGSMISETANPIIEYNVYLVESYFLDQIDTGAFRFRVVLGRKWDDVYYTDFKIGLLDPVYDDGPYWANMLIDAITPGTDWNRYWTMREWHFLYRISIDYLFTLLNVVSRIDWRFEHLKYVGKGELIYALIDSGIPLRLRNGELYACLYRHPYYKTAITETISKARKIRELAKYIGVNENKPIIIEWHRNKINIYNEN